MIKLLNLISEWKVNYKNKYINWLYDEEIEEFYPSIDKQKIQDYLESIIDPTMVDEVGRWINDTRTSDGFLGSEISFFAVATTKEEAFSIPESDVEEMVIQAMSFWLYGNGDNFPFKET